MAVLSVQFPTAQDDADSLGRVSNLGTTTMSGSIGVGDSSFTVASASLLPSSGVVTLVDSVTSAPTKIRYQETGK